MVEGKIQVPNEVKLVEGGRKVVNRMLERDREYVEVGEGRWEVIEGLVEYVAGDFKRKEGGGKVVHVCVAEC